MGDVEEQADREVADHHPLGVRAEDDGQDVEREADQDGDGEPDDRLERDGAAVDVGLLEEEEEDAEPDEDGREERLGVRAGAGTSRKRLRPVEVNPIPESNSSWS